MYDLRSCATIPQLEELHFAPIARRNRGTLISLFGRKETSMRPSVLLHHPVNSPSTGWLLDSWHHLIREDSLLNAKLDVL